MTSPKPRASKLSTKKRRRTAPPQESSAAALAELYPAAELGAWVDLPAVGGAGQQEASEAKRGGGAGGVFVHALFGEVRSSNKIAWPL